MAKKSFKQLNEDVSKHLPTHSLGLGVQIPDKNTEAKADVAGSSDALPTHSLGLGVQVPDKNAEAKADSSDKHEDKLPVHGEAGSEVPDSLKEEEKVDSEDPDKQWREEFLKIAEEEQMKKDAKDSAEEKVEEAKEEDSKEEDAVKESAEKEEDSVEKGMDEAAEEEMKKADAEEKVEEAKEEGSKEEEKDEMKEHFDALASGEELSEETKLKVKTLFETAVSAAVASKVESEKKKISQAYKTVAAKKIEQIHEELETQIDSYLNYIVEEWMAENELAIEQGLRIELAESFITNLKSLFENHYVSVPEEKRDLMKEKEEELASLKSQLSEQVDKNVDLRKKLDSVDQQVVINGMCEGLSVLQTEKFRRLVETVTFESAEDYKNKLSIIKNGYFGQSVKASDMTSSMVDGGGVESAEPNRKSGSEMDIYAAAISHSLKK